MSLPPVDQAFLIEFLTGLLNTPSPTGFTTQAIAYVERALTAFPQVELRHTNKGALMAFMQGQRSDTPRAISSHVDTLGAMVKEIKSSGRLSLTGIGGDMEHGGNRGLHSIHPQRIGCARVYFAAKSIQSCVWERCCRNQTRR